MDRVEPPERRVPGQQIKCFDAIKAPVLTGAFFACLLEDGTYDKVLFLRLINIELFCHKMSKTQLMH